MLVAAGIRRRRIVLRRREKLLRVLEVERAVCVEAAGAADRFRALEDPEALCALSGPGLPDPAADCLEAVAGHLCQVLRKAEILGQALHDRVGGPEQLPIGQDAEPGQRTARRVELIIGLGRLPGCEKLGDSVQRQQRGQVGRFGECCEELFLRGVGCKFRLIGLRPFEQSGRKGAGVASREMRERADTRIAAGRQRNDVRVNGRLVSPLRRFMEIGRDVPDRQRHGVQPVPEVGVGNAVADQREGHARHVVRELCEGGEEVRDVHGRKLGTEEMPAFADDPGDLQRGGLRDIAVAVQRTSPISVEQSTRPSEGSKAMLRLLRCRENAAVLCRRSSSSKPK